ncbi:hypothetical protein I553_2891 [Mycobacterium xenopi 4042]|uniref:Uncharacterized protein n=1 Tax=Mycobacterium xenopi 4042 TaxID=1299334 RepID=X8EEH2_MYCXE|nr:hypothetical protein I553_2891 [Mycobacterium xenopi 4042]
MLAVINRELDADFAIDAYAHVARWNAGRSGSRCGCAPKLRNACESVR